MMLTGFEKLISQARGASRDTSRPYSTIAGMVRTAMAKPAGPTVSWPTASSAIAAASSFARRAAPPTRMLAITKPAPATADSGVAALVTRTPGAMRAAMSAIGRWRSRSMSKSAISEMRRSDRARPPASNGTRTPAPPTIATFIPAGLKSRPPGNSYPSRTLRRRRAGLVPGGQALRG